MSTNFQLHKTKRYKIICTYKRADLLSFHVFHVQNLKFLQCYVVFLNFNPEKNDTVIPVRAQKKNCTSSYVWSGLPFGVQIFFQYHNIFLQFLNLTSVVCRS